MLTNESMKAARFLRLNNSKKLWTRINASWDAGKTVQITTYTRALRVKPTVREAMRLNGHYIQIRRGKAWDICFDGLTGCKFTAY